MWQSYKNTYRVSHRMILRLKKLILGVLLLRMFIWVVNLFYSVLVMCVKKCSLCSKTRSLRGIVIVGKMILVSKMLDGTEILTVASRQYLTLISLAYGTLFFKFDKKRWMTYNKGLYIVFVKSSSSPHLMNWLSLTCFHFSRGFQSGGLSSSLNIFLCFFWMTSYFKRLWIQNIMV